MGRFATTVPYYQRFRPPYPPRFFRRVARVLRLDGSQALIDLGCGPGLLALGFAPFVARVVGVDPEPAMLAAAREAAAQARVPLRLVPGRTHMLPPRVGRFDIATIGRAMHWMPRRPTVARLTRLIRPGGHVLICGASPAEGLNPWAPKYDAFRFRAVTDHDRRRYGRRAADFFAGSPFRYERDVSVRVRHTITIDTLVGRLFSMSNTSPAVLGAKMGATEARLRRMLSPFADARGKLIEVVDANAAIYVHRPERRAGSRHSPSNRYPSGPPRGR